MSSNKKITIAQILPSIESGGVERGVVDLAKIINQTKDLDVVIISSGGSMIYQVKSHNIKHVTLPIHSKNPLIIFFNIFRLVKIIKKYKIDICHARSRAPAWSTYFACKKTNTRFITTFHGTYAINFPFKKLYNSVMIKSETIIAVSNFIKDHIIKNYKCNSDKIKVIHRGTDLDYFSSKNVSKNRLIQLSNQLSIFEDKNIILLPGRLTSWKGHFLLIDALSKIKHKNFTCFIVGKSNAKYLEALNKKIKENALETHIRIVDQISDMPALYKISSIILSTSIRPEAFGRIAIEAGSMEKIIIATNIGGSTETIINNETGFLFDPNNSNELTSKIEWVLELSKDKREKIGKNARNRIEQYFSIQSMAKNTIEIYRNCICSLTG